MIKFGGNLRKFGKWYTLAKIREIWKWENLEKFGKWENLAKNLRNPENENIWWNLENDKIWWNVEKMGKNLKFDENWKML